MVQTTNQLFYRFLAMGLIFGLFLPLQFYCQKIKAKESQAKLIVLIAVDGLGADIFNRYDSLFSGGFRRLRHEGMNFTNAMVDHAMTISHPGHVTLATGMSPAHHGIVAKGKNPRTVVETIKERSGAMRKTFPARGESYFRAYGIFF